MTPTSLSNLRTVRRATRADLPFVAWCNYESSSPYPGFCYWDPLLEGLNTPTMQFIEAVFTADALMYGRVEDFFLIEVDGKPIGGASGFVMSTTDYRPLHLHRIHDLANLLGWTDGTVNTFMERYKQVWSDPLDPTIAPSASWTIECVAVLPEARGQGVGKHLLQAILDAGKALGHSYGGIAVTIGNEGGQKLYESLGFQPYVTYWSDYFYGQFPGTAKYRIALKKSHGSLSLSEQQLC